VISSLSFDADHKSDTTVNPLRYFGLRAGYQPNMGVFAGFVIGLRDNPITSAVDKTVGEALFSTCNLVNHPREQACRPTYCCARFAHSLQKLGQKHSVGPFGASLARIAPFDRSRHVVRLYLPMRQYRWTGYENCCMTPSYSCHNKRLRRVTFLTKFDTPNLSGGCLREGVDKFDLTRVLVLCEPIMGSILQFRPEVVVPVGLRNEFDERLDDFTARFHSGRRPHPPVLR